MFLFSVSDIHHLDKKTPSFPKRSRTYELLVFTRLKKNENIRGTLILFLTDMTSIQQLWTVRFVKTLHILLVPSFKACITSPNVTKPSVPYHTSSLFYLGGKNKNLTLTLRPSLMALAPTSLL